MSELHTLDLAELRKLLDSKEVSSLELTQHFLNRAKDQEDLNAFITLCEEEALEMAKEADQLISNGESKALMGIPIAVKDLILTKGIRTTCASKFLDNFISPYNATVSNKLLEQNAVIIGKTNLDEFAMGSSNENSAYGAVLNPWNKQKVPGGSSGGSAVAVASGLAPASLGTDTGGSIRQPAAFCSVSGLKPTYGRVSRYGVTAYASSLDQVGPMARNAQDLSTMMGVLAGKDGKDATSVDLDVPNFSSKLNLDIAGLKIGVPKEYFIDGIDADIKNAIEEAIKVYENLGAELVEISLPNTEHAVATYYIIAPAEASSNLGRFDGVRYGVRADNAKNLEDVYRYSRSSGFGDEVKRRILMGSYVLSAGYSDQYYTKAQKVRRLIKQDFENCFQSDCDVILSPVTPTTAFDLNSKVNDALQMYLNDIFTIPVNLAGLPALSIPCGFDQAGLPIGLQLIAKAWDEETLLQVANAYQNETDFHQKSPY